MLTVVILAAFVMTIVMLTVSILTVVLFSVIVASVVAPFCVGVCFHTSLVWFLRLVANVFGHFVVSALKEFTLKFYSIEYQTMFKL